MSTLASRERMKDAAAIVALVMFALFLRVPLLYNADAFFNSDEALNALAVKHIVDGKEFTTHVWGSSYVGILIGVTAVPFVKVLGLSALALKLAQLVFFCLLLVVTYLLAKRLGGRPTAIIATIVLACSSPMIVFWSVLAGGGATLPVFFGTLAFFMLQKYVDAARDGRLVLFLLAVVSGVGLYAHAQFSVYLIVLGIYYLLGSPWWSAIRSGKPEAPPLPEVLRNRHPGAIGRVFGGYSKAADIFVFAAGFVIGFSPKLYHLAWGTIGSKRPIYALAGTAKVQANIDLLLRECLPVLVGLNPWNRPAVKHWVGNLEAPVFSYWSLVVLAMILLACSSLVWRYRHELLRIACLKPMKMSIPALMVVLIVVVIAAFVFTPNPQDVLANRYLVPLYTALPFFIGSWIARWNRFHRFLPLLGTFVLVGFYLGQNVTWNVRQGFLSSEGRLQRVATPLNDLVAYLDKQGIRGGYASYWINYHATFLSGEKIIIAPYEDLELYPPYSQYVSALPSPAYIFFDSEGSGRYLEGFLNSRGTPYVKKTFGQYIVFHAPEGGPFYNHLTEPAAAPLPPSGLRVEFLKHEIPRVMTAGQIEKVPVLIRNSGDQRWSARGWKDGRYRVSVAYHWADSDGRIVVFDGERTLLNRDVPAGNQVALLMTIKAPDREGRYRLILTMVQEWVVWFDQVGGGMVTQDVEILR